MRCGAADRDEEAMTYRTVLLFDFGGTLDADGERWAERFHHAYVAAGGRLALEAFEPLFRQSDRQLELEPAARTLGFRAMIEAQAELLARLLPDGRSIDLGHVIEQFHCSAVQVVQRNRQVLEDLGDHYRLGVVSNFTGNLDRCLAELDIQHLFVVIADSALVGWAKPDPRIFQSALEILGAGGDDAWMIGDNVEADIRPAAALGLYTCWLAPPERAAPIGLVPTGRIARLTDLPDLLRACTD
jgi:putative hydrolase of the HAD superfamily